MATSIDLIFVLTTFNVLANERDTCLQAGAAAT